MINKNSKRRIVVTVILVLALSIGFIIYNKFRPSQADEDYERPSPGEVVKQYFTRWSNKDYPNMYVTISDGFKKIEPTAKNLAFFKEYADSQGISGINILSICLLYTSPSPRD